MTPLEFKLIFDEYRMNIFYFCKKMVGSSEDAEDITSAVFISLWQHGNIKPESSKAYLFITANHRCLDHIKSSKRYQQRIERFALKDFERTQIEADALSCIYKIIESLPPKQKEIFKLKYFEEKSGTEIASLLKMSIQNVRNTLSTSLKTIRRKLNSQGIHTPADIDFSKE